MAPKPGADRSLAEAYSHATLGCTFAGGVLLFTGLGWLLDRWLGLLPVFTVAGALVGAVLSFLNVYARIRAEHDDREGPRA